MGVERQPGWFADARIRYYKFNSRIVTHQLVVQYLIMHRFPNWKWNYLKIARNHNRQWAVWYKNKQLTPKPKTL